MPKESPKWRKMPVPKVQLKVLWQNRLQRIRAGGRSGSLRCKRRRTQKGGTGAVDFRGKRLWGRGCEQIVALWTSHSEHHERESLRASFARTPLLAKTQGCLRNEEPRGPLLRTGRRRTGKPDPQRLRERSTFEGSCGTGRNDPEWPRTWCRSASLAIAEAGH